MRSNSPEKSYGGWIFWAYLVTWIRTHWIVERFHMWRVLLRRLPVGVGHATGRRSIRYLLSRRDKIHTLLEGLQCIESWFANPNMVEWSP